MLVTAILVRFEAVVFVLASTHGGSLCYRRVIAVYIKTSVGLNRVVFTSPGR
jgi:hypothetical protein